MLINRFSQRAFSDRRYEVYPTRYSADILDAYAALLVSFFIVKVGIDVLGGAMREFADTAPKPEMIERIRGKLTISLISNEEAHNDLANPVM
jgi:divalent metal cation (Fe/Co/Zn/Cd) transporter